MNLNISDTIVFKEQQISEVKLPALYSKITKIFIIDNNCLSKKR